MKQIGLGDLKRLADPKYQKFSTSLTPTKKVILGVRIPQLKELARSLSKSITLDIIEDWDTGYLEQSILYGMLIANAKLDIKTKLCYFDNWLKYTDNWAECDTVVSYFKDFGKDKNKLTIWEYVNQKLNQKMSDFELRAIIVILFRYYNDPQFISELLDIFTTIKSKKYYVNMALAWGICEILIKHYDWGVKLLASHQLSPWVQNKAIQKAKESFRITKNQKEFLSTLRV